jgi:hypothetical protein
MTDNSNEHSLNASEREAFCAAQEALIGQAARITSLRRRPHGGTLMRVRPSVHLREDLCLKACKQMERAVREQLPLLLVDVTNSQVDGEYEVEIQFPVNSELRARATAISRVHQLPRILAWLSSALLLIGVVICIMAELRRPVPDTPVHDEL